jgi:hypothetical protein
MTDTGADDLVTVDSFRVLPEAEAAKLHLEAAGIRAFLAESEAVDMDWLAGNPFWNVKLEVARGDAERAAALLGELRTRWRESAETPEGSDSLVCLACGARCLKRHRSAPRAAGPTPAVRATRRRERALLRGARLALAALEAPRREID